MQEVSELSPQMQRVDELLKQMDKMFSESEQVEGLNIPDSTLVTKKANEVFDETKANFLRQELSLKERKDTLNKLAECLQKEDKRMQKERAEFNQKQQKFEYSKKVFAAEVERIEKDKQMIKDEYKLLKEKQAVFERVGILTDDENVLKMNEQLTTLEEAYKEKEEKNHQLEERISDLEVALKEKDTFLKSKEAFIEKLKGICETVQKEQNQLKEQMKEPVVDDSLTEKVETLANDLEALKEEKEGVQKELEKVKAEKEALQKKNDDLLATKEKLYSEKAKEAARVKIALDEKEQLQKMVQTEQEKANSSLAKVKELEGKLQGKEEEFALREEEFHSMLQKKVKEKEIQLNEKALELTSMKKHLDDVQGLYQKLLPENDSLQAENNSLKADCEIYEEKLNQLGKYEVDWTRDLINEELQDFGIHVNILPGDQLIFGGEYRGVNIMLNPEDKILFVQAPLPKRSLGGKRLKEVKEICELENTEAMFGSFFTMNDSLYYRAYCSSFDMMKEQIDFGCEKFEKFPNIYLEPKEEIEIEP